MKIAVVGNVDAGKSTLIGRILYDTESLPDSKISEVQSLVNEYKRRFEFAYFLDSFKEELEEERTIDTTRVVFQHNQKTYEIVDVPGHREYIRNMLTGASSADVAILVVAVDEGIQEQTRRHAYLLKLLGVNRVIVVINKIDLVNYDEYKILDLFKKVIILLHELTLQVIGSVAVSALKGEYLEQLLEVLDKHAVPVFIKDEPMRLVVQGRNKGYALARIVSGTLKSGDDVWIDGYKVYQDKIFRFGKKVKEAYKGDCIELGVTNCVAFRGHIGYNYNKDNNDNRIDGETVILEDKLKEGDKLILMTGPVKNEVVVKSVEKIISTETGEHVGRKDGSIREGLAGLVHYKILNGKPLEKFKDCEQLGRFVVYKNNKPIGLGVVV